MIRKSMFVTCIALVAIAGSALLASPAFAKTDPNNPGGNDCATGISGHGSTLQVVAQSQVFIPNFLSGATAAGHAACTSTKVQYNWTGAATGSGAGRRGVICRSDFFGGTDTPYDTATLAQINGTPGSGQNCSAEPAAPFAPNTAPFPAAGSVAGTVLTVPVAIGAVAMAYNLPCAGSKQPQLTRSMLSLLWGGDIKTWGDVRLNSNGKNKTLITNCAAVAVVRATRSDSSGTQQTVKNYLRNIDQNRNTYGPYTCDPTNTWANLFLNANNNLWPGQTTAGASQAATANCSAISTGNGNPGVAAVVNSTAGAIGLIDLSDAEADLTTKSFFKVQAAASNAYNNPVAGTKSNCNSATFNLTAGDPLGTGSDTYAFDQFDVTNPSYDQPATRSTADITALGTKYPICAVTFMMVYPAIKTPGVLQGVNLDQEQTMYDFVTNSKYGILSKLDQGGKGLGSKYYIGLASKDLKPLVTAFQNEF